MYALDGCLGQLCRVLQVFSECRVRDPCLFFIHQHCGSAVGY